MGGKHAANCSSQPTLRVSFRIIRTHTEYLHPVRVNVNGIIYTRIYLLTIQQFIWAIVKIWQGGFQDNPGWEKDAVKDIMIAGMELVDMINNWKHQAWVREMGFSNDCEPSNTCLRQDHRYNYCRAKYKMATHNCCCEDSKLTPISPTLSPALLG